MPFKIFFEKKYYQKTFEKKCSQKDRVVYMVYVLLITLTNNYIYFFAKKFAAIVFN